MHSKILEKISLSLTKLPKKEEIGGRDSLCNMNHYLYWTERIYTEVITANKLLIQHCLMSNNWCITLTLANYRLTSRTRGWYVSPYAILVLQKT